MNYIINPIWFYWLGVVDKLHYVLLIVGIALAVVGFGVVTGTLLSFEKPPRWAKACFICGLITIVLTVFIPSKETLIEMQVAEQATKENVELTVDTIKGMIDYIIAKVGELNN